MKLRIVVLAAAVAFLGAGLCRAQPAQTLQQKVNYLYGENDRLKKEVEKLKKENTALRVELAKYTKDLPPIGQSAEDKANSAALAAAINMTPIDVFDTTDMKVVRMDRDVWEKYVVDPATGYKVDPTNGHKLARMIRCQHCKEMIPEPPIPQNASTRQTEKLLREYKCPKCGKLVYGRG